MIPIVRQDIVDVLREAEGCLESGDVLRLKGLSDHTIHNSSIFQDEDSISMAVIVYSLFKVLERGNVNPRVIAKLLSHARMHLEREEMHRYKTVIRKLTRFISDVDSKFKVYVQDVVSKAEIKKGSRLHYHGISIAQAASLLGISQWELMGYVGKTEPVGGCSGIRSARERLNFARNLLSR